MGTFFSDVKGTSGSKRNPAPVTIPVVVPFVTTSPGAAMTGPAASCRASATLRTDTNLFFSAILATVIGNLDTAAVDRPLSELLFSDWFLRAAPASRLRFFVLHREYICAALQS